MDLSRIICEDSTQIANSKYIDWEKLKGKTVLVSGANGYVPSYFVFALLMYNELFDGDIKVIALCRNKERATERFKDIIDNERMFLLIQDVTDLVTLTDPIHFIIHAASPAGYHSRHFNPAETFNANIIGSKNLLELCRRNPIEGFLLLSSVDVYGHNSHEERLGESSYGFLDPVKPRNSYSISKLASEGLVIAYKEEYGVPAKIVRPFQILGNGLDLKDGRLHADFISQLIHGKDIALKGDGTPLRTFMYVTDAITAMLVVLLSGENGEVYNVCEESGDISVVDLAKLMVSLNCEEDGKVTFEKGQRDSVAVREAVQCVVGDSTKLKGLGFQVEYSLPEAVERIMLAYGLSTKTIL